jgi:hypothetical protein
VPFVLPLLLLAIGILAGSDNLNHPENVLLEREDVLERGDNFPGRSEDNFKVCDNLLYLPNKGLKD